MKTALILFKLISRLQAEAEPLHKYIQVIHQIKGFCFARMK